MARLKMYAIIRTGGKQYKVAEGVLLRIDKINANIGDTVNLDDVLLINDGENTHVGTPTIKGANISCEILKHGKDKKIIVFKHRRRKNYRKKIGHRQHYTELIVKGINFTTLEGSKTEA